MKESYRFSISTDLYSADKKSITFFHSKKYKEVAKSTKALFCLTSELLKDFLPKTCEPIIVNNVLTAVASITEKFYPNSIEKHLGSTTAAAGSTLAILVLPIVIITSAEAIRAVPQALREGGYGVGATKWEVIKHHVLPYAAPGIFTGTLLSLARALGEAAPLILVGGVLGSLGPKSSLFELEQLGERFTAMPLMITQLAKKPAFIGDWNAATAGAILVLLAVVISANIVAILLRNYFENKRTN